MWVPHESIQVTLKTALDCLKPPRPYHSLTKRAVRRYIGRLVTGNGIPQTPKSIPGKAGTGETFVGLLVSTSVWQLKRARSSTSVHGRFTHMYNRGESLHQYTHLSGYAIIAQKPPVV